MDHVELVKRIGRGAGSEVYLARDPKTGRRYALKVVRRRSAEDDKFVEQAMHEYRVGRMLDHPNLMKVYDMEVKKGWFRLREVRTLLEYIEGPVLQQLDGDLGFKLAVLQQVAAALEHMHARGICHADLKPNNVIIRWDGCAKVIDFGLAWIKGEPKHRVQGTQGYLAPEQVLHRVVTPKTDIYNFGILAHRLLTGTMRRSRADGHTIAFSGVRLESLRDAASDLPEPLIGLIEACCQEKPERRPESMAAVREELDRLCQQYGAGPEHVANQLAELREKKQRWQRSG